MAAVQPTEHAFARSRRAVRELDHFDLFFRGAIAPVDKGRMRVRRTGVAEGNQSGCGWHRRRFETNFFVDHDFDRAIDQLAALQPNDTAFKRGYFAHVIDHRRDIVDGDQQRGGTFGSDSNDLGRESITDLVKRIVPILIRDGKYEYPYLGISSSSDLTLNAIEALGLTTYTGAYVLEVTAGGPADLAGVKAGDTPSRLTGLNAGGDLIIAFDGQPVNTFDQLLSYLITSKSPGDTVVLTVLRDGEEVDLTITLGERP